MKRVLHISLILLFVLTVSFAQDGKPNIVIDNPTYDAGQVMRPGAPIQHAFRIRNTGAGELRILDVKPG
jgi:hypothetical protein